MNNIKEIINTAIEKMTTAAQQAKVINPYMQRIKELASRGDDLVTDDVNNIAADAMSDRLNDEAITEIFICLMYTSFIENIKEIVDRAIEEVDADFAAAAVLQQQKENWMAFCMSEATKLIK